MWHLLVDIITFWNTIYAHFLFYINVFHFHLYYRDSYMFPLLLLLECYFFHAMSLFIDLRVFANFIWENTFGQRVLVCVHVCASVANKCRPLRFRFLAFSILDCRQANMSYRDNFSRPSSGLVQNNS